MNIKLLISVVVAAVALSSCHHNRAPHEYRHHPRPVVVRQVVQRPAPKPQVRHQAKPRPHKVARPQVRHQAKPRPHKAAKPQLHQQAKPKAKSHKAVRPQVKQKNKNHAVQRKALLNKEHAARPEVRNDKPQNAPLRGARAEQKEHRGKP